MIVPTRNPFNRATDNGARDRTRIADEPDAYARLRLPRTLNYPAVDIARMFEQSASRFPDFTAVAYADARWTYAELRRDVCRVAAGLAEIGVTRGDRVVLTLPNCPEFIISFLAIQKLGAVVVNAGPLMGVDDLHKVIEMTEPVLIIALDLQGPNLAQATEGLGRCHWLWASLEDYQPMLVRLGYRVKKWKARTGVEDAISQTSWSHLLEHSPALPPTVASDPDDVALLQPTGGTTGTLKVAKLTHRNLMANATQLSLWVKLQPGQDSLLAILPMFHVYGLMLGLITALYSAATIVPLTRFKAPQLIATIKRQRPTMIPLVPAIFEAISDELEKQADAELCTLFRRAIVMSGAAPLSDATAQRFTALTGAPIIQGYGLTEASPVTHANPYDAPRLSSIGLAMPDTLVRIADLADPAKDAPTGEPGELLVSGPQVFGGYLHNVEETERVLSVDSLGRRWLHTGDVARIDDEGYVFILDRRKHMINCSGLKVYPGKVERVLKLHPRISDAAVVGRPDKKTTEIVTAVLVTNDPVDDESALCDELRNLCREHLAPYEVPRLYEFADELPRSALGKLLKYRLRQPTNGEADNGNGSNGVEDPGPRRDVDDPRPSPGIKDPAQRRGTRGAKDAG